jgi:hypothetical protein
MNYLPHAGSIGGINCMIEEAKQAPTEGCFVEIGVWQGGTASYLTELAEQRNQPIYLYDTFTGLPYSNVEHGDRHQIGEFNNGDYEGIKNALPYANVIRGIFPESAIEMSQIAFAHIDVDQYKSYIDCINYLKPKMMEGGIMWFDDYELDGAKKAVDELIGEENLEWVYFEHTDGKTYFKVYTRF